MKPPSAEPSAEPEKKPAKVKKKYNHKCPACGSVIRLVTARVYCDVPITPMGWRIPPDSETRGSEDFMCVKCDEGVPALWVYCEMPQKDAEALMKKWVR